jgi:peptidoglycan/xylan/chitin deacetylase (PgdA/CDA1 family)
MPANSHHKFDFLALGGREYGVKHGLGRLLDVLDGHQAKSTIVASGLMAKLFPAGLATAHQRGHEIAAHQWDQCVFPTTYRTREEERTALVNTMEAMQSATGERVRGYMSPGPRPTAHTLDIIAELDFRWTCDYLDSDIPSLINVNGKRIASVGYSTPGCVDSQLMQHGTPTDVLAEMKYTFDALYDEGAQAPTKFCYAVHTHWGGMPGMARMLDEFLGYVRTREGACFMRCGDIADLWLSHEP